MASTTKELPTRYDQIEEGMEILITNKFGGLPAMGLYTLARMDSENIIKYDQNGIPYASIVEARDEAVKNLSEPHFALGKIVAKYCPDFGVPFDKNTHIAAVYPVGQHGLFSLGSLAELANSHLMINEIPVRNEEIAIFATKEFLVDNATASLNGCHLIIATKDIANLMIEDLKRHNFAPEKIGIIAKKGTASVTLTKDAGKFVASRAKLAHLTASPVQPTADSTTV
jgi:selenophosphate synthase